MAALRWLKELPEYLWDGAKRIFAPSDDKYPETGTQPFDGDPFDARRHHE